MKKNETDFQFFIIFFKLKFENSHRNVWCCHFTAADDDGDDLNLKRHSCFSSKSLSILAGKVPERLQKLYLNCLQSNVKKISRDRPRLSLFPSSSWTIVSTFSQPEVTLFRQSKWPVASEASEMSGSEMKKSIFHNKIAAELSLSDLAPVQWGSGLLEQSSCQNKNAKWWFCSSSKSFFSEFQESCRRCSSSKWQPDYYQMTWQKSQLSKWSC